MVSNSSRGNTYTCSVVVPTCGRPEQLAICLESLSRLETPAGGFEVVVVDDGSPQSLEQTVQPFLDIVELRLLRQPNSGPGAARNAGVAVSRGRFLAFTDDDCRPDREWLYRLVRRLDRNPDLLVGGKTFNSLDQNPYSTASQIVMEMVYDFYNRDPSSSRFFASNNMAMSRRMFDLVGGFDTRTFSYVSEDRELCDRWHHLGHRLEFEPSAKILHAHVLDLRSFFTQHFRYGTGAARYHRVRRQRGSGRMAQDAVFHLQLPRLLRRALVGYSTRDKARLSALMLVWQTANALGFLADLVRGTPPIDA